MNKALGGLERKGGGTGASLNGMIYRTVPWVCQPDDILDNISGM